MTELTRMLFGRSDLELILSSPVDAQSLLAARALSIAIDAVASVGLLLAPLADVAALRSHLGWLALYPVLIAVGLVGTGLGVILAMGLFLAVGPRRARLFSQIAATTVGASFVLGAQVFAMLPDRMRAAILSVLSPSAEGSSALRTLVWTPVRAAAGDGTAILGLAAFSVAVFALACALFGERFAQAAVVASGAPENAGASPNRRARFGGSVGGTLRAKERRVLWRDPWLMSQLLLQAAYTMPVAVILWRSGGLTGTVGCRFHSRPRGDRGAACRRAVLDRTVGRGRAGFSRQRSRLARRRRTGQDRRDRPAYRAPSRLAACCAVLRFALGRVLRSSVWLRSDRLGSACQSLATNAIPPRPGAPQTFAVEARRPDGAPDLDFVGDRHRNRRDRLMGGSYPTGRSGRGPGAKLEVGGDRIVVSHLTASDCPIRSRRRPAKRATARSLRLSR